jgi:transcriptional regulator with XRE-family HTH domain
MTADANPLRELGAALRFWRDRVRPDGALGTGENRRVPGLRRRELAGLAGVSVDYLTQIEQGRAGTPSAHVLAALARALGLSADERTYLFALAGRPDPATPPAEPTELGGSTLLLEHLGDTPAALCSPSWDLLAYNATWAEVHGIPRSPGSDLRNVAVVHFTGIATRVLRTNQQSAEYGAALAADLRASMARRPSDTELRGLIESLLEQSGDFRELWASRRVGAYTSENKLLEAGGGNDLRFHCDVFTLGPSENRLVVYTEAGRHRREGPQVQRILDPKVVIASPRSDDLAADYRR